MALCHLFFSLCHLSPMLQMQWHATPGIKITREYGVHVFETRWQENDIQKKLIKRHENRDALWLVEA